MLDYKFIKDNLEAVKQNIVNRNMTADADEVVRLYDERTALVTRLQQLREKRNENAALMKGKLEEAKPKVSISFDNLDQIRKDALTTMDSLLSDEERDIIEEVKKVDITIDDKPKSEVFENKYNIALEETELQIISLLLNDKSVDDIIAKKMSLPEVLADKINEVFFEEIGDNVVECDLGKITLIEDYRQDVERIIKGAINE